MPRFLNAFWSSFAASSSSAGMRLGSISMIVTSVPKRLKIEANSQPMIPPPRITSRPGTSVCARSPVESTQRGASIPGIGGRTGNEPVATIALLKVTSSAPSTAIAFGPVNAPLPLTHSTPFALKSDAMPPVIWSTTASFHEATVPKSSVGSPTCTPSFANVSCASWKACALCTQAFVGMQPTRRQVPPSAGSCSMQATFPPSCAARIAAVYPAGPPPRTATSTFIRYRSLRSSVGGRGVELGEHREGVVVLVDLREAVALVQLDRAGVVAVDAERDGRVAGCARPVEQRVEQRRADALAARARDDGDGELRRPLVDEPVARPVAAEQPVPGRADREALVDRDHRSVAGPPPCLDVERDGARARVRRPLLPVVGVVEHVAEEPHVLGAAAPDDDRRLLGVHSASAGCSTSATSVCRNGAPSAPSIAR